MGKELEPLARLGGPSGLLSLLEGCSVLMFLQVQQLATIRDSLEARGEPAGPGTLLGLLAHMKKEIQSQSAQVNQALREARSAPEASEGSPS
jgi:hypothetical protein